MRLDLARGRVTVPGPERPGPARKITISGPSATPVPAVLLRGKPAVVAPMTVTSEPGSTGITVQVRLGTHAPLNFTPDTGASQSAVDPGVARQAGLASANARVRQGTVCTVATFPEVRTGLLIGGDEPFPAMPKRLAELYPVALAKKGRADYLGPHYALANFGTVRRAAEAGLPCLLWTVNSDDRIRGFAADPRIAAIISDKAERALAIVANAAAVA